MCLWTFLWRKRHQRATIHHIQLTDHKNLECLQRAKHLNPCWACWALVFVLFLMIQLHTLLYRPVFKNTKVNFLSCLYSAVSREQREEYILPLSCFLGAIVCSGYWYWWGESMHPYLVNPQFLFSKQKLFDWLKIDWSLIDSQNLYFSFPWLVYPQPSPLQN